MIKTIPEPPALATQDWYYNKKIYDQMNPKLKLKDCVGYESDPNILYSFNNNMMNSGARSVNDLRGVLSKKEKTEKKAKSKPMI